LRSGSDDNDVQESETTEANIDTAKLYKLQSDANSQISAGSQTYQLKEKNNELTNEDGGAVESYFINALDIYDQLEGTSGYAQMDNDFKNEVEQNRKTAKEYLTKILKAINDKADQLKKAFGEDDEITKKVNDRIKKIKNRLK
jgi:Ca2+-binding RTX toxin-like protein